MKHPIEKIFITDVSACLYGHLHQDLFNSLMAQKFYGFKKENWQENHTWSPELKAWVPGAIHEWISVTGDDFQNKWFHISEMPQYRIGDSRIFPGKAHCLKVYRFFEEEDGTLLFKSPTGGKIFFVEENWEDLLALPIATFTCPICKRLWPEQYRSPEPTNNFDHCALCK